MRDGDAARAEQRQDRSDADDAEPAHAIPAARTTIRLRQASPTAACGPTVTGASLTYTP